MNDTTIETDEYEEVYAEPDFGVMHEFGTEDQVISAYCTLIGAYTS